MILGSKKEITQRGREHKEGENNVQYENWIKEVLSIIKVVRGAICNSKIISKVLRFLYMFMLSKFL